MPAGTSPVSPSCASETIPLPEHDPLEKELLNFVESARSGQRPAVTGEHGVEVLRIADEILHAIGRARAAVLP